MDTRTNHNPRNLSVAPKLNGDRVWSYFNRLRSGLREFYSRTDLGAWTKSAAIASGLALSSFCAQSTLGQIPSSSLPTQDLQGLIQQFTQGNSNPVAETPSSQNSGTLPQGRTFVPLASPVAPGKLEVKNNSGLITIVAQNATLQEVVISLAQVQNVDIVVASGSSGGAGGGGGSGGSSGAATGGAGASGGGGTSGLLTLAIKDKPLEIVLDAIAGSAGCSWTMKDNTYYLAPIMANSTVAPDLQGRVLRVIELQYLSASDLEKPIQSLLSPAGHVSTLVSANDSLAKAREVIVVDDIAIYAERVADYIHQADRPPRQALFEVHVLQVDLKDEDRHGVNFQHIMNVANTGVTLRAQGFANPNASPAFTATMSGGNLSGVLEAIKSTTDSKTLASTNLMTVNNQESKIQVGDQLGYKTVTTTQTSTQENVQFLDVGVVLTLTPRISADGTILVTLKPEVSQGLVNPTTGLPEESTSEVSTTVLLRDGEGMVIGGLISEEDSNIQSKIKWLGDIKWIGPLFQKKERVKKRSETIFVLLPHIAPLPPEISCHVDEQITRAQTPLFEGPLNQVDRPWEPKLPDAIDCPQYDMRNGLKACIPGRGNLQTHAAYPHFDEMPEHVRSNFGNPDSTDLNGANSGGSVENLNPSDTRIQQLHPPQNLNGERHEVYESAPTPIPELTPIEVPDATQTFRPSVPATNTAILLPPQRPGLTRTPKLTRVYPDFSDLYR